jgi:predicted transcriptional regulator
MADTNTVSTCMSANLVTLHPDMDVMEAVQILTERNIPGAPVIDDLGNFVGLLAEKDCLEAVLKASYYGEWGGCVSEYMQTEVQTVNAATSIVDAARLLIKTSLRGFPVMDNDRIVGQLDRSDLLKALIRLGRAGSGYKATD